jgi:isopentenyl diphosphate isomerase/L-lactate dehydrogenase-like FMN-dependent dehydrogenase
MPRLESFASINDFKTPAKRRLPGFVWSYLEGGAGDDAGIQRNARRLADVELMPKRLIGAVGGTGHKVFGQSFAQPFGIPPLGMPNLIWPKTDRALFTLAAQKNIPAVLSTAGSATIEEAAEMAQGRLWFQLYMTGEEDITSGLLKRAWDAGVRILVWTVDVPGPGRRNHAQRAGFTSYVNWTPRNVTDLGLHPSWALGTLFAGTPKVANLVPYTNNPVNTVARVSKGGLSFDDLKRLRDSWKGTLVIKGVQSGDDAKRLIREGVDAMWVSNHGGRQLESAPATIDTLPIVRAAVGPQVPVLFDSGVRSGEDILKALALGADFVFMGRPWLYGSAAFGGRGVAAVYDTLAAEVMAGLTQVGCPSPDAMDLSYIHKGPGLSPSGEAPPLRAVRSNPTAAE